MPGDQPAADPAVCDPAWTAEAAPSDVIAWSDGRALVATGSAAAAGGHDGAGFTIRQAGSFLVGPGLGLGVMVSGASRVTPTCCGPPLPPSPNRPMHRSRARRCCLWCGDLGHRRQCSPRPSYAPRWPTASPSQSHEPGPDHPGRHVAAA